MCEVLVCVLKCFTREHWLFLTREDAQMCVEGGSGRRVHTITELVMNK